MSSKLNIQFLQYDSKIDICQLKLKKHLIGDNTRVGLVFLRTFFEK